MLPPLGGPTETCAAAGGRRMAMRGAATAGSLILLIPAGDIIPRPEPLNPWPGYPDPETGGIISIVGDFIPSGYGRG